MTFDLIFLHFLQDIRSEILNDIMIIFTKLGDGGAIWILASVIFIFYSTRKNISYEDRMKMRGTAVILLISLVIALIVADLIIKNIVERERPFIVDETLTNLVNLGGYSFPSGHSMTSFAASFNIYRWNKNIGIVAFLVAFFIAFSRIYICVHFPTDIIAGALMGVGVAYTCDKLLRRKIIALLISIDKKRNSKENEL